MIKEVYISPNFFESQETLVKILKEMIKSNPTKIEVSPVVGVIMFNTNGFIENKDKPNKIGEFQGIDVYRNDSAKTDYIEYN